MDHFSMVPTPRGYLQVNESTTTEAMEQVEVDDGQVP